MLGQCRYCSVQCLEFQPLHSDTAIRTGQSEAKTRSTLQALASQLVHPTNYVRRPTPTCREANSDKGWRRRILPPAAGLLDGARGAKGRACKWSLVSLSLNVFLHAWFLMWSLLMETYSVHAHGTWMHVLVYSAPCASG